MLGRRLATGLVLRPPTVAVPAPFTPAALFAAGEQGVWYDPSDLTTMFEDSAGTTAVHTPGNGTADSPVGKILDKSGRGNHATQSTSTARPTLSARYNILSATDTLSTQSVTTVATTYTLAFSGTGTITLSGTKTGTYSSGTNTLTGVTAGTLTLTVSGTVTNADLRVANDGVGLPAYQRVVDANTYDSTDFPYYLKSDGVDDWMSTSNINFSTTQKATTWCGIRKLTDPTYATFFETSSNMDANAGAFACWVPGNNTQDFAVNLNTGPGTAGRYASNFTAPTTRVLCGQYDASATTLAGALVLRLNATVPSTGTFGSTGSGSTYLYNAPLYLFARGGANWWFGGRSYSIIIRGASSTASEINNGETWVNGKTKAY